MTFQASQDGMKAVDMLALAHELRRVFLVFG
jgi:hypothetical protein